MNEEAKQLEDMALLFASMISLAIAMAIGYELDVAPVVATVDAQLAIITAMLGPFLWIIGLIFAAVGIAGLFAVFLRGVE